MSHELNGWRQTIGLLSLVIAIVIAILWVRSLDSTDSITMRTNVFMPHTPNPISTTAMTSAPATVGSLVDRGSESYQFPSVMAERSAIFLLAIA